MKLTEGKIMNDYRPEILMKIQERLGYMIQHHSKVLVVRFDVRYPDGHPYPERNEHISNLMKLLKEWYYQMGIETQYLWVREQNHSDVPHYHIAFLINGSRNQTGIGLLQAAQRFWGCTLAYGWVQGLIHYCDLEDGRAWLMLNRPSASSTPAEQQAFLIRVQAVYERLSYLAKTYSKGMAPHRVRDFGTSLLPREEAALTGFSIPYPVLQPAI